jgi:hypothetical protein
MGLHSLLFSRDQELISLTGEVLKSLNIEVTQCADAPEAVRRLTALSRRVIVDNADVPGAIAALSATKSLVRTGSWLVLGFNDQPGACGRRSVTWYLPPMTVDRLSNGIKAALGLRTEGRRTRVTARIHLCPATLRGRPGRMLVFSHQPQRGRSRVANGTKHPFFFYSQH